MKLKFTTLALACLVLSTPAAAQDILIRNATVHTLTSQGTLNNTDVLIRDGRIHTVGQALPAGHASIVDAGGRMLTPGLFGGLSGIGLQEVSLEASTVDDALALQAPPYETQLRPEFDVSLAYNPMSTLVAVARVEGLTWTLLTPRSAGGGSFLAGQGAAVMLDGRFDAVRDASRSLFIHLGGAMNELSAGSRAAQWMLLEQAVREARSNGPGEHSLMVPAGRETLAKYLSGGRVVFHAERAADIRQVLAFAQRHRLHAVIAGGAQAWMLADELAAADVPVLLDALANLPTGFDTVGARLDNAALLHRAGVRIAFTQFGESHNARKIRQLAGSAVAHGLPHTAALAALTTGPAEIFGLADTQGRIAPGLRADLVLWSGDPLEVTTAAEQVWIGGQAMPMRSRQHELRDRYLQRLRQVTATP